ncbi:AAA family ATPase [Alkalilacustris brevis]|uniref:AAA family ATPase n=1 Tax=Alkalilacustris brevis TaxID=2026338 RepID=UPI0013903D91|nr:ATP-binding protein [Alkalilacustris brevis]
MEEEHLFETDEFQQNVPLFAHTLANVLRSRARHAHLVRPLVISLKLASDEAGYPGLVPLVAPLVARHDRKFNKSGLTRTSATEELIARLDTLGCDDNLAPRAAMLRRNIGYLGEILGLDQTEQDLLRCRMICETNRDYARLMERIHNRLTDLHETLGCVLDVEPANIRKRLSPAGRLCGSGLIRLMPDSRDFANSIELLDRFLVVGFEAFESAAALRERLLGTPVTTALEPDDFRHLGDDLDLTIATLRGALKARARGVNILLYGIPGTGKTELARVLSKAVAAPLYHVGETDHEGGEPSRGERVSELALMQMLLDRGAPAFCCFDEAEDLFSGFGGPFLRSFGSKVFVNRLFEKNPVPVIWIVNDIDALPLTVRRRMTLALKVDQPPRETSLRIVSGMAAVLSIPVAQEHLTALVRDLPASPGVYAKALQATALAKGDHATLRRASAGLVQALQDGHAPRLPRHAGEDGFLPALSNADIDLTQLAARLEASGERAFSLFLHGPSGTGKSAFARHLAERLGMEARALRGSDLLGMFVGQTEAAIAGAFARAEQDRVFLIFDEVDALLHDRGRAERSFELSQVNELLQAMETHSLPFACTSNLFERIDSAALRRFTFRVGFQPLEPAQLDACFRHHFGRAAPPEVRHMAGLTPADFALVRKRARLLGQADDDRAICRMLAAEHDAKPNAARRVGFQATGLAVSQNTGSIAARRPS